VKCFFCSKKYAASNVTAVKKHFAGHHGSEYARIAKARAEKANMHLLVDKLLDAAAEARARDDATRKANRERMEAADVARASSNMNSLVSCVNSMSDRAFTARATFIEWLIKHNIPFSAVDDDSFRTFGKLVNHQVVSY